MKSWCQTFAKKNIDLVAKSLTSGPCPRMASSGFGVRPVGSGANPPPWPYLRVHEASSFPSSHKRSVRPVSVWYRELIRLDLPLPATEGKRRAAPGHACGGGGYPAGCAWVVSFY